MRERARAVSLVWGGLDLGSVIGLLIAPPLILYLGWQAVFYVFAFLGFIWCVLWPMAQPKPSPEAAAAAAAAAAAESASGAGRGAAASFAAWVNKMRKARLGPELGEAGPPWRKFAASRPVWAVVVTHFCFNYGYYTLLAWLPSYFEGALGASLTASSTLSLLPYVAMVAMTKNTAAVMPPARATS